MDKQEIKVVLNCSFCDETYEDNISIPKGWYLDNQEIFDESLCFCEEHSNLREFFDDQCPNCVGGFPECGLNDLFGEDGLELAESFRDTIEKGVCPFRVNGLFSFESGKLSEIESNSNPSSDIGKEFMKMVEQYWNRYGEKSNG